MMKRNFTFGIMVLLVSLLAVGAFAQSGTQTQVKPEEPIRTWTDEGPNGQGTSATDRSRHAYEEQQDGSGSATGQTDKSSDGSGSGTQTQVKPEEPIRTWTDEGPKGQGTSATDRSRHAYEEQQDGSGSATGQADKDAGDTGTTEHNYIDANGANAHGGVVRNGADYVQEGTKHGPEGPTNDANKSGDGICDGTGDGDGDGSANRNRNGNGDGNGDGDGICDATKSGDGDGDGEGDQIRNYGDGVGDGGNHEMGDIHRRGDENTGEGGPHGPMDHGESSDALKIFGDGSEGALTGETYNWGPAEEGGGPFGPNVDGIGYGPAGSDGDDKDMSVIESRGHRGSGRK